MTVVSTARLILRKPEESDAGPLIAMDADPEVMRYIGTGATFPPDRDRALQAIARWRTQWDEQGFGYCSIIVRDTGQYAGWVTLAVPTFLPEVLPAVELGYRLGQAQWGRGYATEAAGALLRFGLTTAGLDRIISIRDVDNVQSRHVQEKLGMQFEVETSVPGSSQRVAVHAITRQQFNAQEL